jgi:hypothetical protein
MDYRPNPHNMRPPTSVRRVEPDMSDEEWELIADLVQPWWTPGGMGRPLDR